MKYLIPCTLLVIALLFTQCQDEEIKNTTVEQEVNLDQSALQQSYQPLQVVILYPTSPLNIAEQTNGVLGENNVTIVYTGNAISFIIPENTSAGNHTLKIEGVKNEFTLKVVEGTVITNPDATIESFINPDLIADPEIRANVLSAMNDYNNLDEEQKKVAAQFVATNRPMLDSLEQQVNLLYELQAETNLPESIQRSMVENTCDIYCFTAQVVKIAGTAILMAEAGVAATIATGIVVGIDVGLSFITGKSSFLLNTAIPKLLEGLKIIIFDRMAVLYEESLEYTRVAQDLEELRSAKAYSNDYIHLDSEVLVMDAMVKFRTLNTQDADSPNPLFSSFIKVYQQLQEIWDEYFKEDFGDLPELVNESDYESVNNLEGLTVELYAGEETNLTYELLDNRKLAFYFVSTLLDDVIDLKFVYDDGYEKVSSEDIEVKIYQDGFLEPVTTPSESVLIDETTEIEYKVVNKKGVPIKDAKVAFALIDGEANLSSETSVSDENGIVSTEVTVVNDEANVELEVSLLDKDDAKLTSEALTINTSSQTYPYWYKGTYYSIHRKGWEGCVYFEGKSDNFYILNAKPDYQNNAVVIIYFKSLTTEQPDVFQRYDEKENNYYEINWKDDTETYKNSFSYSLTITPELNVEKNTGYSSYFYKEYVIDPDCQITDAIVPNHNNYKFNCSIDLSLDELGETHPSGLSLEDINIINNMLKDESFDFYTRF